MRDTKDIAARLDAYKRLLARIIALRDEDRLLSINESRTAILRVKDRIDELKWVLEEEGGWPDA